MKTLPDDALSPLVHFLYKFFYRTPKILDDQSEALNIPAFINLFPTTQQGKLQHFLELDQSEGWLAHLPCKICISERHRNRVIERVYDLKHRLNMIERTLNMVNCSLSYNKRCNRPQDATKRLLIGELRMDLRSAIKLYIGLVILLQADTHDNYWNHYLYHHIDELDLTPLAEYIYELQAVFLLLFFCQWDIVYSS